MRMLKVFKHSPSAKSRTCRRVCGLFYANLDRRDIASQATRLRWKMNFHSTHIDLFLINHSGACKLSYHANELVRTVRTTYDNELFNFSVHKANIYSFVSM